MSRPDLTGTAESGRTTAGAWSSEPGQSTAGVPDSRSPEVTESRPGDRPAAVGPAPADPAASAPTEADRLHTGIERPTAAGAASAGTGVRTPGSRPSPWPRTAPPAAPGPVPDDVTVSNSPTVSTGGSETAPSPESAEENRPEVSSLQSSLHFNLDTLREQIRSGLAGLKGYLTPPSLLTHPPASVAELAGYAHWGAWTTSTGGPLRNLGIVWHRLIGLPVTVMCRYVEWIAQRPGRAIPVYLLWKLLISTGPGPWAADHIIRPVLGVIAWVLL